MKFIISCIAFSLLPFSSFAGEFDPSAPSVDKNLNSESYESGIIPASKGPGDLGAKFRDGNIGLSDLVPILLYWTKWMLQILGSIAVLMVIIAGGQYMYGGASDDKEMGKKTFLNACLGVVVALLSWIVVDIIQKIITSGIT